jgi:hypothetical protein
MIRFEGTPRRLGRGIGVGDVCASQGLFGCDPTPPLDTPQRPDVPVVHRRGEYPT